ncbi:MAG: NAD(P)-dependent oxidoreductase [Rhodospirillaceae bacterium]|jgi:3-hydroxyisobutyrate dehydrogenase|nr:NAD(P)-dependent oxidoreductase [Rhodospirillaceae bacterium]MBT4687041.1 NAD(P)-dependent oxidoreductase [Rhodospirillaceae bacterium]MBT5082557.1 NAD(P)-dependent oxidoreductase [Rhodospirillaceae bacterium]MBT5526113.1 NAD(P)-dependent oxidoreductase [Rhodospirillaceae bacterium]MBT5879642.1 NAD(P)-dependent oxidoreductase [Rhodospirillaceae bacterium]
MSEKVAFIGLGVMGYPMAGHLVAKGYDVTVYNRSSAKAAAWVKEHGGASAATPREAAAGSTIVFACVGADNDLRDVALGENGIFAGMAKGTVFVDHTTASADVAREIHGLAKAQGLGFIDAPVSGGQAGAENGALTVMCGGDGDDFAKVSDAINSYAKMCQLMGPAGSGQLTKMANQICIAGVVQGLSEAMNLALSAGLDGAQVVDVISKGAAQSWQMENRYKTMLADEYEHGFAVQWMRKDLAICMQEAKNLGISLPVAALVDQFYGEVEAMGGARWDTSALLARMESLRPKK